MSIVRFIDGTYLRCDVRRDNCEKPAEHHTPSGRHFCPEHWDEFQERQRAAGRERHRKAVDTIHRIGRGL